MKAARGLALLAAAALLLAYPRPLRADKTDKQYQQAVRAFRDGDLDRAAVELQTILGSKPGYQKARILLGLIHAQRGQAAAEKGGRNVAIAELRQALLMAPDEAYWHSALAQVLDQQGDAAEAEKECQQAAALSPDDWGLASGCGLKASPHPEKQPGANPSTSGPAPIDLRKAGGKVSPPVPVYKPEPPYSERARVAKLQGTTILWMVVNEQGAVEHAQIEKPIGLGLDQEALRTVRTWTFQPAQRAGVPVPVRILVEVSFRLF
ncbi:MAG TPA: TonB family protein [Terriglobia bacterium]|nr:TonB family protein [Terriglobia bacterium]